MRENESASERVDPKMTIVGQEQITFWNNYYSLCRRCAAKSVSRFFISQPVW